jgi:hypothetical protein
MSNSNPTKMFGSTTSPSIFLVKDKKFNSISALSLNFPSILDMAHVLELKVTVCAPQNTVQ